jgi:hypothetical protein
MTKEYEVSIYDYHELNYDQIALGRGHKKRCNKKKEEEIFNSEKDTILQSRIEKGINYYP